MARWPALLGFSFPIAAWASSANGSLDCRLETHELEPAVLPAFLRLMPPSSGLGLRLAIVQLTVGVGGVGHHAATSVLQILPPGLHLFLDAPNDGSSTTTSIDVEEQLLGPLLASSASRSTLSPLRRQFAQVAPAVAADLRRLLGFEGPEEGAELQLLWYHANDPDMCMPLGAIAPVLQGRQRGREQEQEASLLGYQLILSCSSSSVRLTYECEAAPPAACNGCAALQLTAAEPPGNFFPKTK